jgi:5-methylcytosine-specific restriction protein A
MHGRKQIKEPKWIELYRKEILKPKQKERFTEQLGRTEASREGFYATKAWILVRDTRRTLNPLCQICEQRGIIKPGNVVDHIITVEEAPQLALDINNTQHICNFCHNIKTKADQRRKKQKQKMQNGKQLMKELEQGGGYAKS